MSNHDSTNIGNSKVSLHKTVLLESIIQQMLKIRIIGNN
jgi:hypothetical protein